MNSGKLYKKDSKGKIRFWEVIFIPKSDDDSIVKQFTTTGFMGEQGKISVKEIKSNKQGTAMVRAPKLIETLYTNKMRSGGYFKTKREAREEKKPLVKMLAKDLNADDIYKLPESFFPCYGQIKLNGLAGTHHKDKGALMSRSMIPFDKMKDLAKQVGDLGYDFIDCELYTPGFLISDIVSMVRHGDKRICAYIFDVPREDDRPFKKRMEDVMKIKCENVSRRIFTVPTFRLNNTQEVLDFYKATVIDRTHEDTLAEDKVEGIILRPADGVYKWNNKTTRGRDLMKVKPPEDAEFEVVRIECDEQIIDGTKQKLIKFICVTDKGLEFKISPTSWGHEQRIVSYQQFLDGDITAETLPPLSITFREWTKTGKPFHPMSCYLREIM